MFRLPENVITPTTKSEHHDVPISPLEIVAQGLMSQQDWDEVIPCPNAHLSLPDQHVPDQH